VYLNGENNEMSLILSYHTSEFGLVCSDSRVSRRLPDGSYQAIPGEAAKKFIALRPGLVLAGSSNISGQMDYVLFDAVRSHVQANPGCNYDSVADHVQKAALDTFGPYASADVSLHLIGFDPKQYRIRSQSCHLAESRCERGECESGLIISGFVEKHETRPLAQKLFAMIAGDRCLQTVHRSMLALAQEIEQTRTEPVIGPPYHFHAVTTEQTR